MFFIVIGEHSNHYANEPLSLSLSLYIYIYILKQGRTHGVYGGARGVMVIVVGNGHGDTSSNPERDWLHFTYH